MTTLRHAATQHTFGAIQQGTGRTLLPELPLRAGAVEPEPPLEVANALRDASLDAWGRRLIVNRLTGVRGRSADLVDLDELTFMLRSGPDRIGALDFQVSPSEYVPRESGSASLENLLRAADLVDRGLPLGLDLAEALQHGTSIGGARPKCLIRSGERRHVAKLSSSTDTYDVIKAEFVAMRLAALRTRWDEVCDEARMADTDRRLLWRRQILNDLAFEGLETRLGDAIEGLDDG